MEVNGVSVNLSEPAPFDALSNDAHEAAIEDVHAMEVNDVSVNLSEPAPFDALSNDAADPSASAHPAQPDTPMPSPIGHVTEELPSLESPEKSPVPSEASTSMSPHSDPHHISEPACLTKSPRGPLRT
ncbi:hypothetical protein PUNSTDRAFT_135658 [Punctularia strigosozonata HHB-11173 SS5]|uniref:uncharacterized protein n=1 Tax=Punctularia strigosozonata (strain HHB-11173) TaxID=741275 RepID=UPI0004417663|nr:uncharacterized protein PUNSTDRAFT_135658 [Punctularia strigosozonata HHB-11173 SS5]EIN06958.1 hypothetical protein PUNSTDRAFT_135658 [Punctularia strigosozonata HHB-11173 SS5]